MEFTYSPFLFHIGDFGLRYYSLAYLLGALLVYIWLVNVAKYDKDKISDFVLYGFMSVVIGGRLGEVFFYHPEWIWESPTRIVKIWEGGMSFHGGLLAVFLWVLYFVKKNKWDFLKLTDAMVAPAIFGIALAKVGNFFNSELWGLETDVAWCFKVEGKSGCRHPSQLYQAIGNTLVSILLVIMYLKPHRKGVPSAIFLLGYGLWRIIVEIFWRDSGLGLHGNNFGDMVKHPNCYCWITGTLEVS